MSYREKQILGSIVEGLPRMSEFEKGYVLGIVEGKVTEKESSSANRKEKEESEKE